MSFSIAGHDRLLIQTGTWDQLYGFETEQVGDGYERITNLGEYPLNVRRIEATVALRGRFSEAEVLDGNGNLTDRRLKVDNRGGRTWVTLPDDSLDTVLRR